MTQPTVTEAASSAPLAPHVPLTKYYADEVARHGFVRSLFDATASDYDRIENVLAFGSGSWCRRVSSAFLDRSLGCGG